MDAKEDSYGDSGMSRIYELCIVSVIALVNAKMRPFGKFRVEIHLFHRFLNVREVKVEARLDYSVK